MSNKIKSLIIILALFSFLSVGASFDVTENVTTVNLLVDNPIIPGPDSPIIPCPDGSDQFADGPVIPAPDGAPIIPPPDSKTDIQLVDNPIIPSPDSPIIPCPDGSDQFADGPVIPAPDGNDGIIFPNPVPPTTSAVTSIS